MATKSLKDLDHLQSSIKSIVKDAYEQVDVLQKNLQILQQQNDYLMVKNKELVDCLSAVKAKESADEREHNELLLNAKDDVLLCALCLKRMSPNADAVKIVEEPFKCSGVTEDEQVRREIEEISSLDLDTQFDADSSCLVQETPSPKSLTRHTVSEKSHVSRNIFFNPRGITSPDVVLAEESPEKKFAFNAYDYIPETFPPNERTPIKCKKVNNEISPDFRLTPIEDLTQLPNPRIEANRFKSPGPKTRTVSLLFSPLNSSPKKIAPPKGRKRTPNNKALTKNHRVTAEITQLGVRKLSQTRLNMECFKKIGAEENLQQTGCASSRVKLPCSIPLNSLENNIDLDETSLTASAVKRLAANDVVKKETFECSYDRIPENPCLETRTECRKKLPGQECQDCIKFYNYFDNGDGAERQKLLNKFSRHRTKNVALPETPEGYWKPMLTPP